MYDDSGFSKVTTASSSEAAQQEKRNADCAMEFASEASAVASPVRVGKPPGHSLDRSFVADERSRAREKVRHGGARWIHRLSPEARNDLYLALRAATCWTDEKSVPPEARSFGDSAASPVRSHCFRQKTFSGEQLEEVRARQA